MRKETNIWGRFEKNAGRSFEEAADKYIKEFDGKDLKRQCYALCSLIPYIGHLAVIDVDNSTLEAFKDDRREGKGHFSKPAMAGTINKEWVNKDDDWGERRDW